MTTIGMNYDVIPGKESEFEQKFGVVLELIRTSDGHVDSHLYRDVHATSSYVIISEWNSAQEFASFIASDAFKAVTKWGKEQILSARPRHRVFDQ